MVVTGMVTVLPRMLGFDTNIMTFVSSWAKPPRSACFLVLPEYVTPICGVTRMSGVRASPLGGSRGALKSCVIPSFIEALCRVRHRHTLLLFLPWPPGDQG